jgi:TonB family protein
VERTLERVIEQAEQALIEERIDAAAEAIATVRTLQPGNKRLPFLESQLEKERRQLAARREGRNGAVTAGTVAPALETSTSLSTAPISNETQRRQLISRWLTSGRQRLAEDRLLTPENDSAEFYFRQVERADPANTTMQQGLLEIGTRLLTNARAALARQQLELAKRRANEALRFGADSAVVESLLRDIDAAASASTRNNYLRLSLQRTRDNRLFEPDRDNAKYYLGQLQQLDSRAPETEQALRALSLKLIENADQALTHQQMNTAVQLLNETRRLGFNGPELAAAEARVRDARNPPPPAVAVVQNNVAAAPKAIKLVPPKFPEEAMRQGAQGWVDVAFKITASGDVTNATAVAANQGPFTAQFERAAVAAIRQYKFEPRNLTENQQQSMVVRVQFKLQ